MKTNSGSNSDSSLFDVYIWTQLTTRASNPQAKPHWLSFCQFPVKVVSAATDRQTVNFFPEESLEHQALSSPQPSRQITAISQCSQHEDSMLKSSADNLAHEHYKTKLFNILNSVSAIQSTFLGMHTLHVCTGWWCFDICVGGVKWRDVAFQLRMTQPQLLIWC